MKKDIYNKPTLVIDRREWAQKVMYRHDDLMCQASIKRHAHKDII